MCPIIYLQSLVGGILVPGPEAGSPAAVGNRPLKCMSVCCDHTKFLYSSTYGKHSEEQTQEAAQIPLKSNRQRSITIEMRDEKTYEAHRAVLRVQQTLAAARQETHPAHRAGTLQILQEVAVHPRQLQDHPVQQADRDQQAC